MKCFIFVFFIFTFCVFSQNNEKTKEEKSVLSESNVQLEVQAGEFVYNPKGRRDPFVDLLGGKNIKVKKEAIDGIAGLSIDELDLEGIIYVRGEHKACMRGPDGIPYVMKVGDNVYDGEIIKIESHSVVFKKILTVALGGKREKIIKKTLNPEEEDGIK